jgi:pimeloyl-ACP methyl ester carboxylesterase
VGGVVAVAACLVAHAAGSQPRMQQQGAGCEPMAGVAVECVRPSATDPRIQRFDGANYVLSDTQAKANGQLLLFLSGTGGQPSGPKAFLGAAAGAGFRVISLAYNNDISVAVYCPERPSPACSRTFRAMRLYGNQRFGDDTVDNTPAESIVNRFVKLMQYLDRNHPDGGWGSYIANGAPDWRRIVVCGQSQGAGMAAFIAKQHEVARVILFSSPWDYVQRNGQRELAPWIGLPSKTPPERWFGGYHARENMADLLARSYAALKIPEDHIRIFNEDLPGGAQSASGNPFHGQGLFNRVYAEQRAFFLRGPER